MHKLIIFVVIGLLFFILRVIQIGGIDLTYTDSQNEILEQPRFYLSGVIGEILPDEQAGLLAGMLLGDGSKIPYELKKDLQRTSTIHMVVVSGQNLTILAGFLMGLVFAVGRTKTIAITILAIAIYSLLTGLQVPVLRAAVMATTSYFAQILGREAKTVWILLLTAALMLIINPNWIVSLSFQLSFLATIGVVAVAPILSKQIKGIPKLINQDFAVTVSAFATTLPIIAFHFHQISLIGVVTNILILWTIPLIMISGAVALMGALVSFEIGRILILPSAVLLTYFIYIVKFFAGLPFASILVGYTSPVMWIGYYLLLIAVLWMIHSKSYTESK